MYIGVKGDDNMKNKKEKRKILKVRPFNMANFSGGSGYLVFSLLYQAMAILPAMIIIWVTSIISLKKNKKKEEFDSKNAAKIYCTISIPVCVVLAIVGLALGYYFLEGYGELYVYFIEWVIIGALPAISMFFIIKSCYKMVAISDDKSSVGSMVFLSVVLMLVVLMAVFFVSFLIIDPILTYLFS